VVLISRTSCADTFELLAKIEGVKNASDVALWCKADLASESDIKSVVRETTAKFGDTVHVLINNAALFIFKSVEEATADDWARSAQVNITGHALLIREFLPSLKRANGASIVFQGSISSFLAQPNCATYSTMKGAICQLARNCAYDLAKYRIRVNTVCAGTIETPISEEERRAHGWSFAEWQRLKTQDVMLGRVGDVREVANATLFLASDESSYTTAADLLVDGGQVPCTVAPKFAEASH